MPFCMEASCFQWTPPVGVGLTGRYGLLVRFPLGPPVVGLALGPWLAVIMAHHEVKMGDSKPERSRPLLITPTQPPYLLYVRPCLYFLMQTIRTPAGLNLNLLGNIPSV